MILWISRCSNIFQVLINNKFLFLRSQVWCKNKKNAAETYFLPWAKPKDHASAASMKEIVLNFTWKHYLFFSINVPREVRFVRNEGCFEAVNASRFLDLRDLKPSQQSQNLSRESRPRKSSQAFRYDQYFEQYAWAFFVPAL